MIYAYEKIYVEKSMETEHDLDEIEIRNQLPELGDPVHYSGYEWTCLGRYDSLEQAHTAVYEMYSDLRKEGVHGPFETGDEHVLQIYKRGKYEPLGDGAGAWLEEDLQADVSSETPNEQLAKLLVKYEALANQDGYTLGVHGYSILEGHRDDLLDKLGSANG